MKDYAESFYKGKQWQHCRDNYMKSVHHICERCYNEKGILVPAEIVHHIKHVTAKNVNNPDITMGYDNLMAVCRNCHAELHSNRKHRYIVGENGKVIALPD